jgi:hypothetical protein
VWQLWVDWSYVFEFVLFEVHGLRTVAAARSTVGGLLVFDMLDGSLTSCHDY